MNNWELEHKNHTQAVLRKCIKMKLSGLRLGREKAHHEHHVIFFQRRPQAGKDQHNPFFCRRTGRILHRVALSMQRHPERVA